MDGTCNAITKKEAETGFWLNILVVILAVIVLIWSLFYVGGDSDEEPTITSPEIRMTGPTPIVSNTPSVVASTESVPIFPV